MKRIKIEKQKREILMVEHLVSFYKEMGNKDLQICNENRLRKQKEILKDLEK